MNLMPSVSAPVERTTPATAAAQAQASLVFYPFIPCEATASIPIPPVYFPCETGATASFPAPPIYFPCEAGAQASILLPPIVYPCE